LTRNRISTYNLAPNRDQTSAKFHTLTNFVQNKATRTSLGGFESNLRFTFLLNSGFTETVSLPDPKSLQP